MSMSVTMTMSDNLSVCGEDDRRGARREVKRAPSFNDAARNWSGFFSSAYAKQLEQVWLGLWTVAMGVLLRVRVNTKSAFEYLGSFGISPKELVLDVVDHTVRCAISVAIFVFACLHLFLLPYLVFRIVTGLQEKAEREARLYR